MVNTMVTKQNIKFIWAMYSPCQQVLGVVSYCLLATSIIDILDGRAFCYPILHTDVISCGQAHNLMMAAASP